MPWVGFLLSLALLRELLLDFVVWKKTGVTVNSFLLAYDGDIVENSEECGSSSLTEFPFSDDSGMYREFPSQGEVVRESRNDASALLQSVTTQWFLPIHCETLSSESETLLLRLRRHMLLFFLRSLTELVFPLEVEAALRGQESPTTTVGSSGSSLELVTAPSLILPRRRAAFQFSSNI
jgi:hypothetical protein